MNFHSFLWDTVTTVWMWWQRAEVEQLRWKQGKGSAAWDLRVEMSTEVIFVSLHHRRFVAVQFRVLFRRKIANFFFHPFSFFSVVAVAAEQWTHKLNCRKNRNIHSTADNRQAQLEVVEFVSIFYFSLLYFLWREKKRKFHRWHRHCSLPQSQQKSLFMKF